MISKKEKKLSRKEEARYILKEKRDFQILQLIHDLEQQKKRLSEEEKFLLLFCRTQLEKDWRKPLLGLLRVFKKNSKKSSSERIRLFHRFAKKNFWKPGKINLKKT